MKTHIFIAAIVLFVAGSAFTQVADDAVRIRQDESGFGARNLAMGGNGVASVNDYSAIYWNPAGLALLSRNQFSAELSNLNFSNQAKFAGNLSDMSNNYTRLRNLGIAIPLPTSQGSMVLAFGYNFVRDFDQYLYFNGINQISNGLSFELDDGYGNYDWYPFDRNVSQSEEVTDEGGLHQWSLGGAIALSPNFDFGAALNFWSGKDEYRLHFRQIDDQNVYNIFPGDYYSYELNQNLITDYRAFSLKLGGMFKMSRHARLGLALEFPTTFTVTENYSDSDELQFDDGYIDALDGEPSEWQYKVKTPYRLDAGINVQAGYLDLTGSITYQDWSQTRFEKPNNASLDDEYSSLLDENRFLQQDYRQTVNYHLGGELAVPGSNLFVMAGYAVYPYPLKNASPDLDRKYYSGGIGFKVGPETRLDFAYQRGSWKRQSEDSYTPGGTLEDITTNRVLLGLRYSF